MSDDLSAELARLEKDATPGPWDGDSTLMVEDDIHLVIWLRNHTDEIKAALEFQWMIEVVMRERDRLRATALAMAVVELRATVERVTDALDRVVLPHQETGEPTSPHYQGAADYIRAALNGGRNG